MAPVRRPQETEDELSVERVRREALHYARAILANHTGVLDSLDLAMRRTVINYVGVETLGRSTDEPHPVRAAISSGDQT